MNRVPPRSAVQPGTSVSIVLKKDQPTGHEVHGVVQDVLTKGDHPRGVKVRLQDGRIGRVQRLAGAAGAIIHDGRRIATDARFDQPEPAAAAVDLMAYVKPARQKKKTAAAEQAARSEEQAAPARQDDGTIITCPVCHDYQGDEAAVSHHVSFHFSE